MASPRVLISTSQGDITLELNQEKAPLTVANFLSYVDSKHYDNTIFHRVISNFMTRAAASSRACARSRRSGRSRTNRPMAWRTAGAPSPWPWTNVP